MIKINKLLYIALYLLFGCEANNTPNTRCWPNNNLAYVFKNFSVKSFHIDSDGKCFIIDELLQKSICKCNKTDNSVYFVLASHPKDIIVEKHINTKDESNEHVLTNDCQYNFESYRRISTNGGIKLDTNNISNFILFNIHNDKNDIKYRLSEKYIDFPSLMLQETRLIKNREILFSVDRNILMNEIENSLYILKYLGKNSIFFLAENTQQYSYFEVNLNNYFTSKIEGFPPREWPNQNSSFHSSPMDSVYLGSDIDQDEIDSLELLITSEKEKLILLSSNIKIKDIIHIKETLKNIGITKYEIEFTRNNHK
jgi:hypothetical protein